ncbi:MAG: hypothetical protein ACM31C_23515 [Acidobacteriota bacterium]
MRAIALALVVSFAVVACGGAQQPVDIDGHLRMENEITALWTQIRDWRREAHMNLEPMPGDVFQMRNRSVPQAKSVCTATHEVPPKCGDVCELAGDICDNAEAICKIADDLGKQDEYAQDKCASAKASCREAQQRCCNCSSGTP